MRRDANRAVRRRRRIRCPAGARQSRPGRRRRGSSRGTARWKSAASSCRSAIAPRWSDICRAGSRVAATMPPIGYVLSLEGADSIVTLAHLERAYAQGLRAVGPAHYGPGVYAQGTNATGRSGSARARTASGDGAARHDPRRDASLRRELPRCARSLSRRGVGEPLQLPRARGARRQFSDDQHPRAGRTRARSSALPSTPGCSCPAGSAAKRRPKAAASRSKRSSNHIDHICQMAGNASHCRSDRISTVHSGASSARATCTRSPTSRSCPAC